MNRIYVRHIELLTNSDTRSRVFLAYMKIRNHSRTRCGGFSLQDLIKSLSVSDTTARKTLKRLIEFGYAVKLKDNYYRTVSFKTITGDNLHEKFFKLSDEELFSYNWTNISSFRALLVELMVQKNRNTRKKLRKGITITDRHGVKEKVKSQSKKEFDTLVASTYSSKLTGRSYSTILRYRKRQSLVIYSSREIIVLKNSTDIGNMDFSLGKEFTYGNKLIFIPISARYGKAKLHGY